MEEIFSGEFWKARNGIALRDEVLSIQMAKSFLLYLFFIGDQNVCCGWSYDFSAFH